MKQKNSGAFAVDNVPLLPRKKLVTTSRSKAAKVTLNFKIDKQKAALVKDRASALHRSKTELIVGAIERCLQDDVWGRGRRSTCNHGKSLNPPRELVELSNILVELAFVVNTMITRKNTKAVKDQASRIYMDAVLRLENVRQEFGC